MMNNHPPYVYETQVEWTGQRTGELRADGLPRLEVAPPPEFRGMEGVWTPEHLFVASVNSCFMTTFLAIAELSRLEFVRFDCDCNGLLEKLESSGYQITKITLRPHLVVRNSKDIDRALRILEKAERNCLISNSIKAIVSLEPEVNFDHEVALEMRQEELIQV
jgi:peroxiredoxin-like protein